jgi:hypothetical protein
MQKEKSVFEESYESYLSQLREFSFMSIAPRIGAVCADGRLRIPLFDRTFEVSSTGIAGPDGRRPSYDVCVLLSKYILLAPEMQVAGKTWVSYRDFKDSRPLHNYFSHDVELAVATHFSGRIEALKMACASLGGYEPDLKVSYDLAMQFDALPMIPVVMLFNNTDDEFPARCSLLFPACTEAYLDAECIAMLGSLLFRHLKRAAEQSKDT